MRGSRPPDFLHWFTSHLHGHNARDRSECVNVIGVIREPFAVKGRKISDHSRDL